MDAGVEAKLEETVAEAWFEEALLEACSRGDLGGIRAALEKGPLSCGIAEKAWSCAALSGNNEAFDYLVSRGIRTPDHGICGIVAGNRRTAGEALRRLSGSGSEYVRRRVAANPSCPPDVLEYLACDPLAHVSDAAFRNPSMPEDLLRRLILVIHQKPLESIPNYTYESQARHQLAQNPALTDALVAEMLEDENPEVRSAMAALRPLREDLRRITGGAGSPRLSTVPVSGSRWDTNPEDRPDVLDHLHGLRELDNLSDLCDIDESDEADEEIRAAIAANPGASRSLLHKLARDPSLRVRQRVAENPSTSSEALQILAADEDPGILIAVSRRPDLPPEVIPPLLRTIHSSPRRYDAEHRQSVTAVVRVWGQRWHGLSRSRPTTRWVILTLALLSLGGAFCAAYFSPSARPVLDIVGRIVAGAVGGLVGVIILESLGRASVRRNRRRRIMRR